MEGSSKVAGSEAGPSKVNLAMIQPTMWSPFTPSGSESVFLVWSYDAEITFNGQVAGQGM